MIKKANDRKAFQKVSDELNHDITIPVDIESIELLLKILKPAYKLNIMLQSAKSSIGDLVPFLVGLNFHWKKLLQKLNLPLIKGQFLIILISEFDHQFE